MLKLTIYIPDSHLEAVKAALFAAGAGAYEGYDCCCWQVLGTGQFRPLAGSKPFIGETDCVEKLPEWRVEMTCPETTVSAVKQAIRTAHPYQVPAYDFTKIET